MAKAIAGDEGGQTAAAPAFAAQKNLVVKPGMDLSADCRL
jgi:hypothetical protein